MARSKRRHGNRSVVAQFNHLLSVVIWSINLLSIHEKCLSVGHQNYRAFSRVSTECVSRRVFLLPSRVCAFSECSSVCSSSPAMGASELKSSRGIRAACDIGEPWRHCPTLAGRQGRRRAGAGGSRRRHRGASRARGTATELWWWSVRWSVASRTSGEPDGRCSPRPTTARGRR
jgi:hypothetical protein